MTVKDPDVRTITLLGFGEAGTTLARGLVEDLRWPASQQDRVIRTVDIALGRWARGEAMVRRAEAWGIAASDSYDESLGDTDMAFSVVTGEDAVAAAESLKPYLKPGALYCDFNSITANQTRAVGAVFDGSGVDFVDVAVMGGFLALGHRVPLVLSGPRAEEVAAWMADIGLTARVLNDRVGDASAVKILRSVLIKGIEALGIECLTAAHREGLTSEVLATLADVDRMGMANFVQMLVSTHLVHAKRRLEEMDKAAANLDDLGIAPLMTEATRRTLRRTVDQGAVRADGVVPEIDEALRVLSAVAERS